MTLRLFVVIFLLSVLGVFCVSAQTQSHTTMPTPYPTSSATPNSTPSGTSSVTPSASSSPTPSTHPSMSSDPTPSGSHTPSNFPTPSHTAYPSPLPSRTPTNSRTPSQTPSITPTASHTPSPTPARTASPSVTTIPAPPSFFRTCNATNLHATIGAYSEYVLCCQLNTRFNNQKGNATVIFYQLPTLQAPLPFFLSQAQPSSACQKPSSAAIKYGDSYIHTVTEPFSSSLTVYNVLVGFSNPNPQPIKIEILDFSVRLF